ncbi:hypothetical protein ACI65C_004226 [Semiaphis heraclei]
MATRKQPFNTALKFEFYEEIVKKNSRYPKKLWSTIKEITTQSHYRSQNYKININNSIQDSSINPLQVANTFNTYFINMGNSNPAKTNSNTNENIPITKPEYKQSLYIFRKITKLEVLKIISDMRAVQNDESDMYKINEWFLKHNLRLNFAKTKYITFSQDKITQPYINTLKIHKKNCNFNNNDTCEVINRTENSKYLGVTIDQHLKWDAHVNNLIIKMRKLHYFYLNARKILDRQTLRIVYFAMTQSLLQYGITAWGGLGIVASNKLLIAQKSIIKIILNKPKTFPSENLFKDFKVFNVQQLFQRNSIYYVFKLNLINIKPKTYNTRQEKNIIVQTYKTLKTSRHFVKVGLDLLNNMPQYISNCKNYTKYKRLANTWLIRHTYEK